MTSPTAPLPAEAAEQYVAYDLPTGMLVEHRETMRVSWYATAGTLGSDRTGRTDEENETFTENVWTAPDVARSAHILVVLRDARGGLAFASYEAQVR